MSTLFPFPLHGGGLYDPAQLGYGEIARSMVHKNKSSLLYFGCVSGLQHPKLVAKWICAFFFIIHKRSTTNPAAAWFFFHVLLSTPPPQVLCVRGLVHQGTRVPFLSGRLLPDRFSNLQHNSYSSSLLLMM